MQCVVLFGAAIGLCACACVSVCVCVECVCTTARAAAAAAAAAAYLCVYYYILVLYTRVWVYNKGPAITQPFDPKCADRKWKINYVLDNGQFPFTDA